MANTTKLIAGSIAYSGTSAGFTAADFNSLANGSGVLAATAIANGTNLDVAGEVSFSLTCSTTIAASSAVDLYLLPLNQDGTTYGDGTPTGSAAPSTSYYVGSAGVRASGTVATGTIQITRDLPLGSFKFFLVVTLGSVLASSAAAAVAFRSSNVNLNG